MAKNNLILEELGLKDLREEDGF